MTRRSLAVVLMLSLGVGVGATLVVGPQPPSLADTDAADDAGDPELASRVREVLGDTPGRRGAAVAVVETNGEVRFAGVGDSGDPDRPTIDETTSFEIGSVTKALTGMVLADQVARGEVSLTDPLDKGGEATLEELATHRSGLPRLPRSILLTSLPARISGADPYRGDEAEVLATAVEIGAPGGAQPVYSNLGAAALGDALALQAGGTYAELLQERLLTPLGMTSTVVATTDKELPDQRARGSAASGSGRDPWLAAGWAPAGVGVWSTARDQAALLTALLGASAPGQQAVEPTVDFTDGERIGLFWRTLERDDHLITFHNGTTAGAASFVGFDRSTGRGIVVLTNTDANVDDEALELLLDKS